VGNEDPTALAPPFLRRPLAAAAILYWLGLILGRWSPLEPPLLDPGPPLLAALAAGLTGLLLSLRRPGPRLIWPLLPFLLLGLGLGLVHRRPPEMAAPALAAFSGREVVLTGTVTAAPDHQSWGTYLTLRVSSILSRGPGEPREHKTGGRLRVLLPDPDLGWPRLAYGSRIRFQAKLKRVADFANRPPGGHLFSPSRRLADRGVLFRATVSGPEKIVLLAQPGGAAWWRAVERWRGRCRSLIRAASPEGAGLLQALLMGEKSGLSPPLREAFRRTGLAHLLVVSGLHLAVVASLSLAGVRFLLTRSARLCLKVNLMVISRLLALIPVLFYALLAGPSIPTWRAFTLVTLAGLAPLWARRPDPLSSLALAGLILTLVWPPALFDLGFQLSFIAVAALLWFGVWFQARLERLAAPLAGRGRWLRRALLYLAGLGACTAAVALALAPLLALSFNRVPVLGLALNLVLVPLYTLLVLPAGLSGLVLSLLEPALGGWLLHLAGWSALAGARLVEQAAGLAAVSLQITGLTPLEAGLAYLLLAGLGLSLTLPRRRSLGLALAGLALLALAGDLIHWHWRSAGPGLEVTALDVGRGSSTLIKLPGGRIWLIDGGGSWDPEGFDFGARVIAPALWARKIDRVQTLVLTHPHPDHYQGLIHVLEQFGPRQMIYPGHPPLHQDLALFLEKAAALNKIDLAGLHEGLDLGQGRERLFIQALWPPPGFLEGGAGPAWLKDPNESSLVLKLTHGRVRFLFPADIQAMAEVELCRLHDLGRIDLRAEVLLVPHHAGRGSASRPFLARVEPKLAVYSCRPAGRNPSPHPETLERLKESGALVLGTDRWGAVRIASDGADWSVRTALERLRSLP